MGKDEATYTVVLQAGPKGVRLRGTVKRASGERSYGLQGTYCGDWWAEPLSAQISYQAFGVLLATVQAWTADASPEGSY